MLVKENSELSQICTEKQIIPFKTTVNELFNDIYLVIGCFDWKIGVFHQTVLRGLLYAQRRTLALDDLTVLRCFRVIFSLKKKTIQFTISLSFFFQQKKSPKLSICDLLTKSSVWVFDITNRRNGFSNFQSYHQVVMYLFNSLVKSCMLFWKYSETIHRYNIFELTYYK